LSQAGLFNRMLVPLDGSPNAESILYQAQQLLCGKKGEVLLLHALDAASPAEPGASEKYLKGVTGRLTPFGARVRSVLRQGPLDAALQETIRSEEISLVALSSHGRRGDSARPVSGTVERIVMASEVPVFVSRAFERGADGALVPSKCEPSSIRRILVPIDGRGADEAILPAVRELGLLVDALIVIARVGEGGSGERIEAAAAAFSAAGLKTTVLTLDGDPSSAILDFAHPSAVDLVALGNGPAARRVLNESILPTLLIRN
jgi:nucleotide-binding universal stress UspA family protein